jgi:hypothetical protein
MSISVQKEQAQIQRFIYLFLSFVWLLRCYQGLLLFQLHQAPFISVKADNVFWLYHAMQIPRIILEHQFLAFTLDIAWLIIAFLGLFKTQNRWIASLICFLVFNYLIIYNSVSTHHEHILVGLLFFVPVLLIRDKANFVLIFAGIRYYAIFILVSAGLWKVYRGSLFTPNQMSEILKHQHIDYLITYPEASFSHFISYLIRHPNLANLLWYGGWVIELTFVLGFFTRRFDKLLGSLFILFFIMDYLLMQLCFVEFCIFALVFYPWKGIWEHYKSL